MNLVAERLTGLQANLVSVTLCVRSRSAPSLGPLAKPRLSERIGAPWLSQSGAHRAPLLTTQDPRRPAVCGAGGRGGQANTTPQLSLSGFPSICLVAYAPTAAHWSGGAEVKESHLRAERRRTRGEAIPARVPAHGSHLPRGRQPSSSQSPLDSRKSYAWQRPKS